MKKVVVLVGLWVFFAGSAHADVVVPMHLTRNEQPIGTIEIKESPKGLVLIPHLQDLPPGLHGFHVHLQASCENHGDAACGHLDPKKTGKHLGPFNPNGHLGDLPVLEVSQTGKATKSIVAPRLTLGDVRGHALMIHAGGDNYSDLPKKLGGGGSRIACGIVSLQN